jgi:hypothetical protein
VTVTGSGEVEVDPVGPVLGVGVSPPPHATPSIAATTIASTILFRIGDPPLGFRVRSAECT